MLIDFEEEATDILSAVKWRYIWDSETDRKLISLNIMDWILLEKRQMLLLNIWLSPESIINFDVFV
jgi:hypothetical protein